VLTKEDVQEVEVEIAEAEITIRTHYRIGRLWLAAASIAAL